MSVKAHMSNGEWKVCKAKVRPCPLGGDEQHRNFKDLDEMREYNQRVTDEQGKKDFGIIPSVVEKNANYRRYKRLERNSEKYLENENAVIFQDDGFGYIVDKKDYKINKYHLDDKDLVDMYAKIIIAGEENEFQDDQWHEYMKEEIQEYNDAPIRYKKEDTPTQEDLMEDEMEAAMRAVRNYRASGEN